MYHLRKKKTIDDYDDDINPDGTRKSRIYSTYILKPIDKIGIAFEPGNAKNDECFITYVVEGDLHFTLGYYKNIIAALESVYTHVLNGKIVKAARRKQVELEFEEIKALTEETNKRFEKLWLTLETQ